MKKIISLLLALCLALALIPAVAEKTAKTESVTLPDFTVKTIDGADFILSEALKDHELVLINLFATWCGPCQYEFPFLQEAWSANQDKVAVVALSIEPTDTEDVLRQYAKENNLSFPIGRVGDTGLDAFVTTGIPTTVLVDRTGRVSAVEVGAMQSVEEFTDLFSSFTGENYNPELCTYTLLVHNGVEYLPDVTLSFCTDTACTPVTTDENGVAEFQGPPAKYHLQLVDAPEGCGDVLSEDIYTEPYSQTIYVYIPAA